jgi:hypothetical protein|tara:strand:+ start:213 stop:464 length:252 start_codon:yes stop_codon:yes gene_type:complete
MMSKEDINIHLANMRRLKMEQVINYYNDLIKDLDRLIKRLEDLGIEENKDSLHNLALIQLDLGNSRNEFQKEYEMQETICEKM